MEINPQLQGRRVDLATAASYHPAYVVWELTLRCDHACRHCGSRALKPRADELSTSEALNIVQQLSAMGTREVVLIGGEAYLHEGFLTIVAALKAAGITPVMTSGGMGITPERAQAMASAGLQRVSISIDGLEAVHGQIRRRPDSFAQTTRAIQAVKAAGMVASANTHFNRLNLHDLEGLYAHLVALGVNSWQVQITAALGRAADHPEMLFQPWDLLDFLPRLMALKRKGFRDGLLIMPGNNLGYFGPEEARLRSPLSIKAAQDLPAEHFQGCQAGKFVMGIESQGAVKGCPSLQSKTYVGGNLRAQSLAEIWNHSEALAFRRTPIERWGFCASCPFGSVCEGGCTFTAHALFGKPGNNPYCHFRARSLQKQGLRERLVPQAAAPGQPFDHRFFELVTEAFESEDPALRGERALPMV